MDTANVGRGTLIAGVSGVLLFIFMFFSWYGIDKVAGFEVPDEQLEGAGQEASFNAWEAFSFTDLVLLLAVLVAVGVLVIELTGASVSLPVAGSALTVGLGALALLLLLYRVINPPSPDILGQEIDLGRKLGLFLGLLATAGITYGGYQGMQEEGTSFGDVRDDVRDRIPEPPPRDPPPPRDR